MFAAWNMSWIMGFSVSRYFFSNYFARASHLSRFCIAFLRPTPSFSNFVAIKFSFLKSSKAIKVLLPIRNFNRSVRNWVSTIDHHAVSYIDSYMACLIPSWYTNQCKASICHKDSHHIHFFPQLLLLFRNSSFLYLRNNAYSFHTKNSNNDTLSVYTPKILFHTFFTSNLLPLSFCGNHDHRLSRWFVLPL